MTILGTELKKYMDCDVVSMGLGSVNQTEITLEKGIVDRSMVVLYS